MEAVRRIGPIALFAILPVVVATTMFTIALTSGPIAHDFRNELYPQAEQLLEGSNPYPQSLWPPLAMAFAVPFTVLPSVGAGVAVGLLGLACMALALWLVGVSDWRVYGVVCLWPQVLGDIRIAHLTPLLCVLAAVAWRYRDRSLPAGLALGVAGGVKLFLWPLGVWLVASGRARAAGIAAAVAVGSVMLVAPFAPFDDYLHTLRRVSDQFDQDSYSTFGLLTQLGVGDTTARLVTFALGAVLLALTWRRASFALAIASALMLSPIVWFDFYALAAIPLAIARPRLSLVWFIPLVTWGLPSSGIAADPVWGVARVLVVFAVVLLVAAAAETPGRRTARGHAHGLETVGRALPRRS